MLLPVYPNRVSLQKVGVSSQENEVFCLVKRSFSTTNSSFYQNKTPFSVFKYGVLFSSIAKIFTSSWRIVIYLCLLFSQNFQCRQSLSVSGLVLELMSLKIVNRFLRKNPQMVKNVKSEIVCRKVVNGKGKMSLKRAKRGERKTKRSKIKDE